MIYNIGGGVPGVDIDNDPAALAAVAEKKEAEEKKRKLVEMKKQIEQKRQLDLQKHNSDIQRYLKQLNKDGLKSDEISSIETQID